MPEKIELTKIEKSRLERDEKAIDQRKSVSQALWSGSG